MGSSWRVRTAYLLALLPAVCGCAQWATELGDEKLLPLPRMSPDSVVLEQVFVTVQEGQLDLESELWSVVDEQQLSVETRRRLQRNGFRGGVLGTQLPDSLQTLLNKPPDIVASLSEASRGQGASLDERPQRRQLRAGRRAQILAGQELLASLVVLLRDDDGTLRGDTYEQAQCQFSLVSQPLADGRVRLELTPEVHYGQPKQGWVGHEGAFRWDAERQRRVLDQLRVELTLAPGETLVLSCTSDAAGVGRQFFVSERAARKHKRLLLIRLAQTQFDDLFAPERIVSPIATPSS